LLLWVQGRVVDHHHRWMSPTSLIGNLDLVVGTWAGIRDTRLGKTWQGRQSLCLAASARVPCEWERRDEDFGVRMKTTGVTKLSAFHTNAPVLLFFPRQPSISIHDWPSFSGTDALPPPLILFLKKIRSKDFSLRLTLTLVLVHVRSLRSQVKDSKANHLKFKCRV
jgi:hypothetical protein